MSTATNPMDCLACQAHSVHEILQAGVLEWVAILCVYIHIYISFKRNNSKNTSIDSHYPLKNENDDQLLFLNESRARGNEYLQTVGDFNLVS